MYLLINLFIKLPIRLSRTARSIFFNMCSTFYVYFIIHDKLIILLKYSISFIWKKKKKNYCKWISNSGWGADICIYDFQSDYHRFRVSVAPQISREVVVNLLDLEDLKFDPRHNERLHIYFRVYNATNERGQCHNGWSGPFGMLQ